MYLYFRDRLWKGGLHPTREIVVRSAEIERVVAKMVFRWRHWSLGG